MTNLTASFQNLDSESIATIALAVGLGAASFAVALQAPEARAFCARLLNNPEVQKAGGNLLRTVLRGVVDSLGGAA